MQTVVTVSLWRSHPAFSWPPFSFNSCLWRIHKSSVYLQFLNPQNRIQGICWFSLPFTMQFGKDLIEFRICCCSSLIFFTETMPTVSLQFFAGCSLQIDVVLGIWPTSGSCVRTPMDKERKATQKVRLTIYNLV
jgi:hypothetical protein